MKNIHLIPTDNYSQLVNSTSKYGGLFLSKYYSPMKDMGDSYQNIYITYDEEIKEGDWCYYLNNLGGGNTVCQAYKHSEDKRMLFDNGNHNRKIGEGITPLSGECKKIILTTNQDLIKDGVQSIDDEFLEWLVKNPSCEKVEVVKEMYMPQLNGKISDGKITHELSLNPSDNTLPFYKIIIPQEEPKQEIDMSKYISGIDPYDTQETLEEAANKYVEDFELSFYDTVEEIPVKEIAKKDFIEGAKWQAERMYSEKEVLAMLLIKHNGLTPQYVLEQFKKK